MDSQTIPPFWKLYQHLSDVIRRQADEAFAQFQRDPYHPGLHFKEVNPRRSIWSARINDDFRTLGIREGNTMYWFWIGNHREYEKVLNRL